MIVGYETEAADVALEVDNHLRVKPQAKPHPQKRFDILVVGLDDIGTIFDTLMFSRERESADIDG